MKLEELRGQCIHDILNSQLPTHMRLKLTKRLGGNDLKAKLVHGYRHYRGKHNRRTGEIEIVDHLPSVLVHEVTHSIGGNELDAEIVENVLYPKEAIKPDGFYDRRLFEKDQYTGTFFYLSDDCEIRDTLNHSRLLGKQETLSLLQECLR